MTTYILTDKQSNIEQRSSVRALPLGTDAVRRALMVVIIFSIVARLVTAFFLGDVALPVSGASDQVSYDMLAQRVLAGHGFSFPSDWYPFTHADEQTAHWSFLYTLFLSAVYALSGHHPLAARLVQVLLSSVGIWLAFRIGQRLFNERVGLAAAALTSSYAYFIFFNASLMTQTFYITALLATLNLTLSLAEKPSARSWLLLGLALGVGTLLRQTLLIFSPLLFIWLIWRLGRRVRWTHVALSLAVVAALILPWTLRNYMVYHDFLLLNSNGGYWLYASNHPAQGVEFDQNYVAPLPDQLRGASEPAIDRALYSTAIGFITSDPVRFARLTLSRVNDYFAVLPSGESTWVSNVSRIFSFTLYLPFMALGIWLSRRHWRICLPLYLYIAFDTTLHLMSWAAPRYRLPTDALLMLFAGLAVVALVERVGLPSRWAQRPALYKGATK